MNSGPLAGVDAVVYGVGAQKAGTSWLFDQLSRHPDVHFEPPSDRSKELHYWDSVRSPFTEKFAVFARQTLARTDRLRGVARLREVVDPKARRARLRAARYEALLSGLSRADHTAYAAYLALSRHGQRVVGDFTPRYALLGSDTYAEMAAIHPNARFIFVMRDPVDRLWSGVRHRHRSLLRGGRMTVEELHAAFRAAAADPLHPDRQLSDYARTIAALEAGVPRERVLYLFYETMFEPESAAAVFAFLDLAPIALDAGEKVNEGDGAVARPPAADVAIARAALAPVYDFVARRFGGTPEGWSAPAAAGPGG